jgi:hypothetical protein
MGRSFARELARRYGVSYEQLVSNLQERGILPDNVLGEGPPGDSAPN